MISDGLYYDEHTFYFEAGPVTNEQFMKAMETAIRAAASAISRKIPCEVRSNIIFNKEGKATGVGYARVSNPEVYRMLMGRNPDNSERIQYIDTPCKEEVDVPIETFTLTSSWADAMDGETEELKDRPSIKLEPLMKLPPIPLTKEQMGDNNRDTFTIQLKRAYVTDAEEGFRHNVLYCSSAPLWVTDDVVRDALFPYSTSKKKSFPIVKVLKRNNLNSFFITFDPLTRDAQFAIHMCKKLVVTKMNNSHTLYLGLARDNGR